MALPRQYDSPASPLDWRAQYTIENPTEVDAYVQQHPSVRAILDEAPGEIQAVFGADAQPRLRLTCDPEDGDCWLIVGIPMLDVGPAALPLIDAFDERWWLARMPLTDAAIVFDVVGW